MSRARTNANNWAADITEVQAGTGISVTNGTGPAPTVTNSMATAIDAKGDLVVGSGADAFVRVPIGANNQVLTADSATTSGVKWAAPDPLTTKGDLFTFSTTEDRLPVGANGETLVADSSTSTGLRWQGAYTAGKNALLNGALDIWQRGTSFSGTPIYTADRWLASFGNSVTVSRSTDVPNSNFLYSLQLSGSNFATISQRIEGAIARQFVGRDVVISFWAKSSANTTLSVGFQAPGGLDNWFSASFLGGSGSVNTTTTWQRFSFVIAASNLTSAAANGLSMFLNGPTTSQTYNITGIQMEIGNVATPFQTATGTLAGELAACQRYYNRFTLDGPFDFINSYGYTANTTTAFILIPFPVQMRAGTPALDFAGNLLVKDMTGGSFPITTPFFTANGTSGKNGNINAISSGMTGGRYAQIQGNNDATAYIGFSREL